VSLSVASIASLVIFLIVTWSCFRNGLFSTLVMLFIIVFSSALAMGLFIPVSKMFFIANWLGWYTAPLTMLAIFLISLLVMQAVGAYLFPPRLSLPKLADMIGGAALGLVNAWLLTGFLMVAFALFPGTGNAEDKVVFLGAEAGFVKSMSWLGSRAGSVPLKTAEFLAAIKKEKFKYIERERTEVAIDEENRECFTDLSYLYNACKLYAEKNEGKGPTDVSQLVGFAGVTHDMAACPASHLSYRLFPVTSFKDVEGDENFVLIWEPASAHLGAGEGKFGAVFADGRPHWVKQGDLEKMIRQQKSQSPPAKK
jgi:hypothetical protein